MADTATRRLAPFLGTAGRASLYRLLAAALEAGVTAEGLFARLSVAQVKATDADVLLVDIAKRALEMLRETPHDVLGDVLAKVLHPASAAEQVMFQLLAPPSSAGADVPRQVRLLDRLAKMMA